MGALLAASSPQLSSSVSMGQIRLLSTQAPHATLRITNTSGTPLVFDDRYTVIWTYASGTWTQHALHIADRDFVQPVSIAPGTTYTGSVPLPACEVTSEPCLQNAVIEYRAGSRDALQTLRSNVLQYEVVPDPAATYAVSGANDGHPVFIAYGIVRDTIYPDTLLLRFSAAAAPSFPVRDVQALIVEMLRAAGVDASGYGWKIRGGSWLMDIAVDKYAEHRSHIDAVVRTISAQIRARARLDTQFVTCRLFGGVDQFGRDTLDKIADRQALQKTERLARIVGSAPVGYGGTRTAIPADVYLGYDDVWFGDKPIPPTLQVVSMFEPLVLPMERASTTPITFARETVTVGSRKPSIATLVNPSILTSSQAPPPIAEAPFSVPVPIAADKPEMYVVGVGADERALRAGLSPEFYAMAQARRKIAFVSSLLRVKPRHQTLFAQYPLRDGAGASAIGVASTFGAFSLERLKHFPPQPEARVVGGISSAIPPAVPISLDGAETLIAATATTQTTHAPDGVRLDAYFSGMHASPAESLLPDPQQIARRLRRVAHVTDTAATSLLTGSGEAAFEIVIRHADAAGVARVAQLLRNAYSPFHPKLYFHIAPIAENCGAIESRLLGQALRGDAVYVVRTAMEQHRPLRTLLLVSALPLQVEDDPCRLYAEKPWPGAMINDERLPEMPRTLSMRVTATLVVRTFPSLH